MQSYKSICYIFLAFLIFKHFVKTFHKTTHVEKQIYKSLMFAIRLLLVYSPSIMCLYGLSPINLMKEELHQSI